MSKPTPQGEVTQLLQRWSDGDDVAFDRLYEMVYKELHSLAASLMRRERSDHTLQPTALVNEAYLRLAGSMEVRWENRVHFLRIAGRAMRRVLVDHARKNQATKRISAQQKVPLDEGLQANDEPAVDCSVEELLAIDAALEELQKLDQRQASVVELRFFAGMTVEETATVLEVSAITVKREWRLARLWLRRRLEQSPRP